MILTEMLKSDYEIINASSGEECLEIIEKYGTTTLSESVSGYDASMLLTVVVYLLPVAFLLRKKKLPEVQLYWGAYTQK